MNDLFFLNTYFQIDCLVERFNSVALTQTVPLETVDMNKK